MTNYNDANDLASQLIEGRSYQGGEPCKKPSRIVFTHPEKQTVVIVDDGRAWADVATEINRLLAGGYDYGLRFCGRQ